MRALLATALFGFVYGEESTLLPSKLFEGNTQLNVAKAQISEHGASFQETVVYDSSEHSVRVHVPKHHDLIEHITIMNNATRKEMIFYPELLLCELTDLPEDIDPVDTFNFLTRPGVMSSSISSEETSHKITVKINEGSVDAEELAWLPQSMQQLCHGVPVQRVRHIEVKEEDYQKGLFTVPYAYDGHNQHNHRTKRSVCPDLQTMYGDSKGPNWVGPTCIYRIKMSCSTQSPTPACMQHFMTPGNLATILCCRGGESTRKMCTCEELEAEERIGIPSLRTKWAECKARYN